VLTPPSTRSAALVLRARLARLFARLLASLASALPSPLPPSVAPTVRVGVLTGAMTLYAFVPAPRAVDASLRAPSSRD